MHISISGPFSFKGARIPSKLFLYEGVHLATNGAPGQSPIDGKAGSILSVWPIGAMSCVNEKFDRSSPLVYPSLLLSFLFSSVASPRMSRGYKYNIRRRQTNLSGISGSVGCSEWGRGVRETL